MNTRQPIVFGQNSFLNSEYWKESSSPALDGEWSSHGSQVLGLELNDIKGFHGSLGTAAHGVFNTHNCVSQFLLVNILLHSENAVSLGKPNSGSKKFGHGSREIGTYIAVGKLNYCRFFRNCFGSLKRKLTCILAIPLLNIHSRDKKLYVYTRTCIINTC